MAKDFHPGKAALAVAILIASAFADTLYLKNGQEIKDATVTKVGESEVEYKIGKRETVYTAKKSDITIILYSDGAKDIFNSNSEAYEAEEPPPPKKKEKRAEAENFTTGQRWGTWALNAFTISGLGSWVIMGDVSGGFIHLGLTLAGASLIMSNDAELGVIVYLSGSIWNIIRSTSHDKPHSVAYGKYEGFNFAVMPNQRGNLIPAVTYNKAF